MSDEQEEAHAGGSDYEQLLLLEDLESLAEEMDEIGVRDRAAVRRRLAQPQDTGALGGPPADAAALQSILALMEELGIADRATLAARIGRLHEDLDWA